MNPVEPLKLNRLTVAETSRTLAGALRRPAEKEHSRHVTRKLDAQRWLDEVTASDVTGQFVDPR